MARSTEGPNTLALGPQDSLSGTLTFDGSVRISGKLEGELHATGDVDIEQSGHVDAIVDGKNVTVRGRVTGSVVAARRLLIAGSGAVSGDVRIGKLAIEDGAVLNGSVSMDQSAASSKADTNGNASYEETEMVAVGEESFAG